MGGAGMRISEGAASPAPSAALGAARRPSEEGYLPNGGADPEMYPKFGTADAREAVVNAGEMLYIPSYWWHHISSLEETVSLTFWFKCGPTGQVLLLAYAPTSVLLLHTPVPARPHPRNSHGLLDLSAAPLLPLPFPARSRSRSPTCRGSLYGATLRRK